MSATHAKSHRPNPIRSRVSCPDCGFDISLSRAGLTLTGFTCPRCSTHYDIHDFWLEQYEKWLGQNHKRATADLSGEQDE
jgi:tRNA(Ile2) C34 agmatinyltransferase TiaS